MSVRDGPPVILLHGWPYDIHSFVDVGAAAGRTRLPRVRAVRAWMRQHDVPVQLDGPQRPAGCGRARRHRLHGRVEDREGRHRRLRLGRSHRRHPRGELAAALQGAGVRERLPARQPQANKLPLPPAAEYQWWYQFYFSTARGELGYAKYQPRLRQADLEDRLAEVGLRYATYDRTAASFENPDYVAIVIHNYRWRLGLADGERQYDALEAELEAGPVIAVPTITMEGDSNGAPHAPASAYRAKFSGKNHTA